MSKLYAIIGGLWGAFLGGIAAFNFFAFSAAVLWLAIIGDGPSPTQLTVGHIFIYVAFAVGVCIFVGCIIVGVLLGKFLAKNHSSSRLWIMVLITAVAYGGTGYTLYTHFHRQQVTNEESAQQQITFCQMYEERKKILSADAEQKDGFIDVMAHTDGQRSGPHILKLSITDSLYDAEIFTVQEDQNMQSGPVDVRLRVAVKDLAAGYKTAVLKDTSEKILVDEKFVARLSVEPVLTTEEATMMPTVIPGCAMDSLMDHSSVFKLESVHLLPLLVQMTINY